MVLVHGTPDRSKSFAHVVHQLSDLPVTVYDRRGYGKSLAAGSEGGGFGTHADDLIAILDGTPAVVVGQSVGGVIAMLAATRAPELFLALGVWEPAMTAWDWWPPVLRSRVDAWGRLAESEAISEWFRTVFGDARWAALPERSRQLLREEGKAFHADMVSQDAPCFELDQLRVPRLLGCGAMDSEPATFGVHTRTAEMTGCELLVVEGADHVAYLSHPDAWVRFVRATVELADRDALTGQ